MRSTVVITIITVVLAIAAGVAIAGLPSTPPGADVVIVEVPTVEPRPNPTLPTVTVRPVDTTTSPSSSTTSEAPLGTTTTTARQTTSSVVAGTTVATEPDPVDAFRERSELSVAAANASDQSGVATAHATLLDAVGYAGATPVDAEVTATSAVYYVPGLELEAARLATDLGWDALALAPMDEIPSLLTTRTFELVALVGLDKS